MRVHRTDSSTISSSRSAAATAPDLCLARAELDEQRRLRTEQLDELAADAAEAVALGDDQRLQVTRALAAAAETSLTEIDAALARVEAGTYGTCERCDENIPVERLEVLPMTRLCTRCQYLTESRRTGGPRRRQSWPVAGPR
jgi:DnaK suppressor protein